MTTVPIARDRIAYFEQLAAQHGCGAVVTFVGIVRADREGGRTVKALSYEAYVEMAECQIDRLVAEVQARWPLEAVQIQHRLGFVEVGQIGVVIVVAAQHRAEAYAASRFLMEGIKHQVPIWKREFYSDGTSRWAMHSPLEAEQNFEC